MLPVAENPQIFVSSLKIGQLLKINFSTLSRHNTASSGLQTYPTEIIRKEDATGAKQGGFLPQDPLQMTKKIYRDHLRLSDNLLAG
jgi:hypothetical protein